MKELDQTSQFRHHNSEGGLTSPIANICIIIDSIRTSSPSFECLLMSGWQWDGFRQKLLRAGFNPERTKIVLNSELTELPKEKVIVGLGEVPLRQWTDKKSVDKYHMTPIYLGDQIYIPTFDLGRVQKQFEFNTFQEMAFRRAAEISLSPSKSPVVDERFLLNPSLDVVLEVLERIKNEEEIAVDVETGWGQINTVGFAWSPHDAIAINTLPDRLGSIQFHRLWEAIREVLEGPSRKIFQNFIYDTSYFSAYGIHTEHIHFDTMFAQKVLWPEFKSNLGNVGRIYTRRPYWKDDGKVTDEEGVKKNWGNIRDWTKHYTYNCRDTTGTLEASRAQRTDLRERGLASFYFGYIDRLKAPIREMCARGMPLDLGVREALKQNIETELDTLTKEFQKEAGAEINPRSSKQKLTWLKSLGIEIPKKFDKEKGISKETTDSTAIKKIRLKRPDLKSLQLLQEIATKQKALSSYIDFIPRGDARLSFSINGCGTETLRFSGNKDGWGRGVNIQTLPREGSEISIKQMFVAPEGWSFLEIDLQAAESRFVAYASADSKLIQMLEDGEDVHAHVAHATLRGLGRSTTEYSKHWRNLAKKTGHGTNYLMKEGTFIENVFKDMEIVLSRKDAKTIMEAYHQEFPKIRQWQGEIKRQLWQKRKLVAPSGWERYFYGRPDDSMWREGVAWTPQHTIPWITNHLMFYLLDQRRAGNLDFHLIAQVHDSLILLVPDERLEDVARSALCNNEWHPLVELPGGRLLIPRSAEAGKSLAEKKEIKL